MRTIGTLLWRFMVIFSFIVNIVLVIVLLLAGAFIFQIKNQVADPLIGGLYSTATGLGDATIDWVIPVRDTIPVVLDIPLQTNTTVVLTADVPLTVTALIDLPPILGAVMNDVPATVELTLPQGLVLPVALDLNVPVDQQLAISLDVRTVIPLRETQLIDPINQLGLLFEPLAIGLWNLPNDWGQAADFANQIIAGDKDLQTLLLSADGNGFNTLVYDPWTGYSRTAGLNYPLFAESYPVDAQGQPTGIVVPGGIPALDALLPDRDDYYVDGSSPRDVNEAALQNLQADNINPATYDGTMADYYLDIQANVPADNGEEPVDNNGQPVEPVEEETDTNNGGSGIIPTPTGN